MSKADLTWEPGLVALHKWRDDNDLGLRISEQRGRWAARYDGKRWPSNEGDLWVWWSFHWCETPVWVGSPDEWATMRALAKDPADLLAMARRLTAAAQAEAAEPHEDHEEAILTWLNAKCGIDATDLDLAEEIIEDALDAEQKWYQIVKLIEDQT